MTTDLSDAARAAAACAGWAVFFALGPRTAGRLEPAAGLPATLPATLVARGLPPTLAEALRFGFPVPALVFPALFVVVFVFVFVFFFKFTNVSVFWNNSWLRESVYALDRA